MNITPWIHHLGQLGRSDGTLQAFRWELEHLMAAHPHKQAPADYSTEDLLAYLAARRTSPGRRGDGLSPNALKRSTVAIKSFFRWALGGASPAASIPTPRPKRRVQRALDWAKAFDLLASCDTSSPVGARDLALLTLMIDTGLRAAEVCRLRCDQMLLEKHLFWVRVKGGAEKFGLYTPETGRFIAGWLAHRERVATPETATLFCSVGGLTPGRPLTTDGLRRIMAARARRAEIGPLSPHDLRRTFATLSTEAGAPTELVRQAGRWEDIHQVLTYTQSVRQLAIREFLPVGRLMR